MISGCIGMFVTCGGVVVMQVLCGGLMPACLMTIGFLIKLSQAAETKAIDRQFIFFTDISQKMCYNTFEYGGMSF